MLKALVFGAILTLATLAPAQAGTAAEAESFVQTHAEEIIEALESFRTGDRSLDAVAADFRERIDRLADVPRITNFVLGRYLRTADAATLEEFREVFRAYAIETYERELANYAGQTLTVTGSITRAPDDWIVQSEVTGGPDGQSYDVNWRVQERDGVMKVLDVEVLGIWLAQTQRDQILSIIGNNRGQVSAATAALRERLTD